jgi:glycosyltransferase involved in cell wall biosynthesis
MRVAYVCSDPGVPVFGTKGASVHVQEVVRVLRRLGHEVVLHTARPGGEPPADLRDVRVHDHGRPMAADTASREHACLAADDALEAELVTALAAEDVDLVYERYSLWGGAGVRAASRVGLPAVLEVNAPLVEEQATHRELVDRVAAERRVRSAVRAATATVCVSEPVAAWARARAADPRRVHVVPNGVDTDRVRPGDARDPRAYTVGFVGTLRPWHGVDDLVAAVAQLRTGVPTARLRLIGDGPGRQQLLDLSEQLDVPADCTGVIAPTDVPAQLHRLDVAVAPYPAHADYFSPLKLYEYLAAGLPVVASAVGQVPDILEHGRAGLLVPPGDPAALAQALRTLALRPATARRLRSRARRLAVTRYTWQRTVERTLAAATSTSRSAVG